MTTSNSTDFTTNRDKLISGVLEVLGVNDPASNIVPTSRQISQASDALNIMIKAWANDGLQLWALKEATISLTNTEKYNTATLGIPKPLKVIGAYRRNIDSKIDVPLRIVDRDTYNSLPNKTGSAGIPVQVYYDPQLNSGDLYVWPFPGVYAQQKEQIIIRYQRPFEDFDAATDTPDFPQEWLAALKWNLALELAFNFGLTERRISAIGALATRYKDEALDFSMEEGSVRFTRGYK
jgi:hypothetical protein